MDFAIEDSVEQSAFREEVRAWLDENMPDGMEFPVDPGDPAVGEATLDNILDDKRLPRDLAEAASRLDGSERARALFGDAFVDWFAFSRRHEADMFRRHVADLDRRRYLDVY